jgi:RNA-directed DNA polymerase
MSINNRMTRIRRKIEASRAKVDVGTNAAVGIEVERLRAEYAEQKALQLRTLPTDPFDVGFRRFRYVRYADDFLVGIIGSKADAQEMMDAIREFLHGLKLKVSDTKSAVRHASDGVTFLGYDVHSWTWHKVGYVDMPHLGKVYKRPATDGITLSVPRRKVVDFCVEHRYGDILSRTSRNRPTMLQSSLYEIVSQFNMELRGFANYYALAGNVKTSLNSLQLLCRGSMFRTIANKLQIRVRRVMKQMRSDNGEYYGKSVDLNGKVRVVKVWCLRHLKVPAPTNHHVDRAVGIKYQIARNDLVDLLHADECSNCGSSHRIELHHVRKLADHNGSPFMLLIKAARTRKRIPLCTDCHDDLHAGRLKDYRSRKNERMESRVH